MKARDLKELRTSNSQDLKVKLNDLKAELFNLRFQLATGQLENPMRIREVKKSIAQMNDRVVIMETRPLSKDKRWRLVEIVERAK